MTRSIVYRKAYDFSLEIVKLYKNAELNAIHSGKELLRGRIPLISRHSKSLIWYVRLCLGWELGFSRVQSITLNYSLSTLN